MKRIGTAAMAALLLAGIGVSRADFGGNVPPAPPPSEYPGGGQYGGQGYGPPSGASAPTGASTPGMYGPNPIFRRLLWWKKSDCEGPGCGPGASQHLGKSDGMIGSNYDIPKSAYGPYGQFGPGGPGLGGPPGAALPGTPANQMPGTLVFPNNPNVRSPRDFFMYEPGQRLR